MAQEKEREVVTELLELYRDLPCLWDLTCESYKDSTQKRNAWDILAHKLNEIDPTANAASAKKKIDNLRISYLRESKKEQQIGGTKRKKLTRERNIEIKKEKMIEAANNLLTSKTETNAFGVYVGKKMEEIPLGQQRDLAEKLISEIMFLVDKQTI
ncbi:unnamed protein product, partial [Brenthis ino]